MGDYSFGFCEACTTEAKVERTDRVARTEACSRCHALAPIGAFCEVDTPLFVELFYADVVDGDTLRPEYAKMFTLAKGVILEAGSGYPFYQPRRPAMRRIFFSEDLQLGPSDVCVTDSRVARFGPRVAVPLRRLVELPTHKPR